MKSIHTISLLVYAALIVSTQNAIAIEAKSITPAIFTKSVLQANQNLVNGYPYVLQNDHYPAFSPRYDWLKPIFFQEQGAPQPYLLNRWKQDVTIEIGFPSDSGMQDDLDANSTSVYFPRAKDQSFPFILSEEFKEFVESISNTLPINLSVSKEVSDKKIGTIRLLRVENNGDAGSALYKPKPRIVHFGQYGAPSLNFLTDLWPYSFSTKPFVHEDPSRVHGGYQINQNQEIVSSFCFIHDGVSTFLESAQIKECVVRSLGVPNMAPISAGTILGKWSEKHLESLYHKNTLTDEDADLLTILYSKKLSTGMDYFGIYEALKEKD